MKTHHTDQEIQAAVDAAFRAATSLAKLSTSYGSAAWDDEAEDRLDVAKILLARLPEPPPPVVDGKTPGQVCHESMYNTPEWKWLLAGDKAACENAASAVLAAFGQGEAVDWEAKYELEHSTQLMRTGQLQSARERAEKAEAELAMSEAAFSNYRRLILSSLNEAGAPTHHPDSGAPARKPMTPQERIKSLTQLRSIAEATEPEALIQPAEEIPWTEWHGGECPLDDNEVEEWEWQLRDETVQPAGAENKGLFSPSGRKWNHIGNRLDIIAYRVLRWKKKPNPETFDAAPAWQPAIGDTVKLKSGGPVMTVMRPAIGYEGEQLTCMWATDADSHMIHAAPACLKPATKEETK